MAAGTLPRGLGLRHGDCHRWKVALADECGHTHPGAGDGGRGQAAPLAEHRQQQVCGQKDPSRGAEGVEAVERADSFDQTRASQPFDQEGQRQSHQEGGDQEHGTSEGEPLGHADQHCVAEIVADQRAEAENDRLYPGGEGEEDADQALGGAVPD